jgi:hypothetical protein
MNAYRWLYITGSLCIVAVMSGTNILGQTTGKTKIPPLAYISNLNREPGGTVSLFLKDSIRQSPGQAPVKKISGEYQGYSRLGNNEYNAIDSLCRRNFPPGLILPHYGDTIVVYYGAPNYSKTFIYTGFLFERSALSAHLKIPVRLDQLPIYIETIDSILFRDSLSLTRYDLYELLKQNLLPVNTVFTILDNTGTIRFPFNRIDETEKLYRGNPRGWAPALITGCVIAAGIVGVIVVAEFGNMINEATSGCKFVPIMFVIPLLPEKRE